MITIQATQSGNSILIVAWKHVAYTHVFIATYVHVYTYLSLSLSIYIYMVFRRFFEKTGYRHRGQSYDDHFTKDYIYIYICIYIYIYREREIL